MVKIHRVKVTGPWEGKLTPLTPATQKPVLIGEKHPEPESDHRVRYAIYSHPPFSPENSVNNAALHPLQV